MNYQKATLFGKNHELLIEIIIFEMMANHKNVSNMLRAEADRETMSIQAMLENMNLMIIKGLQPKINRYIIKIHVVFETATSTLSQDLFFEILANHKEVSKILRVETKRETISIQAMMKHMNSDDVQRPETQDQTINYQK